MFDRSIFIRHLHFTEAEFAALQSIRTKRLTGHPCAGDHQFTDHELAHLRFMHWMVRRPEWNQALDKPVSAGVLT